MLLWIDGDAPPWGTVWILALDLALAQNVRAGMAFMAAKVANSDGTREDQFGAARNALIPCPVNTKPNNEMRCGRDLRPQPGLPGLGCA
jgi:hypothetical protein